MTNNKLRPIMFVGTGSDVGKSVINAAFCRIFLQDGYRPAPFKGQNMSLNSFPTKDGCEIGRAQAVQAQACGIEPLAEMNPILLKPTSDSSAQIVVNGKPIGNQSAAQYFLGTNRELLFGNVIDAFGRLDDQQYNPIVIEGAGSISEVNLWDKDITNMRVAEFVGAATFLIADIDKGGVFGSVFGTIALLAPKQRDLIAGIIINKFRGDIALFTDGINTLQELTGKRVVGVIPYFDDIMIDQEDSLALQKPERSNEQGKIKIAVVLLRHMSNFTDFNYLERVASVHLIYAKTPLDIETADIVIIPGTKNTIEDLIDLRRRGMGKAILTHHDRGKAVYGICGGYQMMGTEISDPFGVEGDVKTIPGLGLLPVTTTLTKNKKTEQCQFRFLDSQASHSGYEIHMGQTNVASGLTPNPLCHIDGGSSDGYHLNPKTWGTYIHAIFDNNTVLDYILGQVDPTIVLEQDFELFKDAQFDKLADLVRSNIDMDYVYECLGRTEAVEANS